jgi:hypothetical protein
MKQLLKSVIKKTPAYPAVRNWNFARSQERALAEWEQRGRPVPPPHIVKQQALRHLATEYGLRVLVETGTYYGDMVAAMKPHFDQVYSIELSRDLYEKARRRFAGDEGVTIIQGDSGVELGKLVARMKQPVLFWLDGHYSAGETARGEKETPIYEELMHIFDSQQSGHVIVIDDARCFGTDPGYPRMEELRDFIMAKRPDAGINVEHDSIRIIPHGTSSRNNHAA